MGLFDRFYLTGRWAEACKCPNGHPMVYELQTKELDCAMATVVCNDDGSVSHRQSLHSEIDYGALDRDVEVGGECRACEPIFLSTMIPDHYNVAFPCMEICLRFREGRLVEATQIEWQSNGDYQQYLKERGSSVVVYQELPEGAVSPDPDYLKLMKEGL